MAFTKLSGTAFVSSIYGNNSSLYASTKLNDGNTTTYWASGNTADGKKSEDQLCGILFTADTPVHRVKVFPQFWGKEIVFGYASTSSTSKAAFTVVRRIDTRVTPNDDLGVAIDGRSMLTFDIPLYPKSKAFAMFMDTPASTGIMAIAPNDYAVVYEFETYTDPTFPEYVDPYTKATGNVFALDTYSGEGSLASLVDGNKSTFWHGNTTHESTAGGFIGIQYPAAQEIRKLVIDFYRWGSKIIIGVADSIPATSAGFTVIRTIDTTVTPTDDLGVPWGSQRVGVRTNTILLPAGVSKKVFAIINADNLFSPLSDNTITNTRLSVYEIETFTTAPATVVEIKGTAFCDKNVALSGQPASFINDGNVNTIWFGSKYGDTTQSLLNFCGIKFATPKDVSYVLASINVWGNTVKIGTWAEGVDPASASFTIANIIPISSCNILVDKDVDGKTINSRTFPYKYNATAKSIPGIIVYCDSNTTSELGNFGVGGAPNNALCLRELQVFGADGTIVQPPTFVDGLNPRPPTTIPVSPFTATPQNWVRTEYATAGDFDFVPDPTTTLLFIAIQGGGGGGAVTRDQNWNLIPVDTRVKGGETYVATTDGKVWSVDGGNGLSYGNNFPNPEVPVDWVRTPITPGASNGSATDGTIAAAPGVASIFGTAGASYSLNPVSGAGNDFIDFKQNNGSAYGLTVSAQSNFIWGNGTGWYSVNRGESASTGYVQFNPITLTAGQALRFTYGVSSEANYDKLTITVGGVIILTASGEASTFVDYTIPSTGSYIIRFQYQKDGSAARGSDYCWVTLFTRNGAGYPPSQSGAAGRLLSGFVLPRPLRFRVGAGGVGIPAGQILTTAAHGTRGSGGAAGGNGGTGVIVVYEYKLQLPFEKPQLPDMSFYNAATAELSGVYRTNYYGIGSNSKQNYVHKLRPRTKRVLVLMVGAGGGSCHWTDISGTIYNSGPAIVSTGTKTLTAESGGSSYKSDASSYVGGSAGAFTSDVEVIYSKDGLAGTWLGAATTGRVTEFYGNYGNSSLGAPNSSRSTGTLITACGGSGALALAVLTEAMLQSRELAIQVPGIGRGDYQAGTAGAVIIFETESTFDDVFASQVSELVLQRGAPYANTQVSQVNQLLLQKDVPFSTSQVSQVVLMVLQRSPTVVGTSVTEQTIEIIGKAEPSNVRVSQSIQSVLVESEPPQQNVSQVAALVLIKENPTLLQMMDFGVMRFPMKNELYLSDICTVVGIGGGKSLRFQLEGDLPVGSTLIYNGVDIQSLTVMIKDGDTVQLHSGVTNWFVTTIYVFVYVSRADQIVREYAGFWSVLQATLSGRKRATIGALSSKRTIVLAKTGSAIGVKKAIAARSAKESKAQLVARRAIENVVKTSVTAKATNGNAVSSPTKTIDRTVGEAVLSVTQTLDRTVGEAVLSTTQTFDHVIGKDALTSVNTFRLEQKPKVANFNMYIGVYASGNTVKSKAHQFTNTYGEAVLSKAQKFSPRIGSPLIRFGLQSIPRNNSTIVMTDVFYSVAKKGEVKASSDYNSIGATGYRPADQHFVVFDYSKSASLKVVTFLGNSQQAGSFFRPGYVYTPAFVAANSETIGFTAQENDKIGYVEQQYVESGKYKYAFRDHGYFWRASPNRDVGAVIQAVAAVSANRVYWGGLGWEGRHPPAYIGVEQEFAVRESNRATVAKQEFAVRESNRATGATQEFVRREFNRANGATQSFAVRINNSNLIPVQYKLRKTNILLYGMRPMLYQAGKNRIDKAKYYMGFTTQAEVNAFIVNFLKPTTKLKLDGYVYRVGIDETLVCEIRGPNMPLAWLMRGG